MMPVNQHPRYEDEYDLDLDGAGKRQQEIGWSKIVKSLSRQEFDDEKKGDNIEIKII